MIKSKYSLTEALTTVRSSVTNPEANEIPRVRLSITPRKPDKSLLNRGLNSSTVIVNIFAFLDFNDIASAKLRMISKKTKIFSEHHHDLLARELNQHDSTLYE